MSVVMQGDFDLLDIEERPGFRSTVNSFAPFLGAISPAATVATDSSTIVRKGVVYISGSFAQTRSLLDTMSQDSSTWLSVGEQAPIERPGQQVLGRLKAACKLLVPKASSVVIEFRAAREEEAPPMLILRVTTGATVDEVFEAEATLNQRLAELTAAFTPPTEVAVEYKWATTA